MTTRFIGTKFLITDQWGPQEHWIVDSVRQQVDQKWPDGKNLVVSLTWFGPQFNNTGWTTLQKLVEDQEQFENLIWVAAVDPLCFSVNNMHAVEQKLNPQRVFYVGPAFESPHEFNTGAVTCWQEFPEYTRDQVELTNIKYVYLCYNRKPKPHRIKLVDRIFENQLETLGVITLGADDVDYDVTEGMKSSRVLTIDDDPRNYTKNGKYNLHRNFGGVPYDLLSLGRLDIWQQHFLNIVSETEFREWDNTFVTEKTWKPIIGLRPFLINGQAKVYSWLRDRGFRTFTHYFDWVDIENQIGDGVQDSIVAVVKRLGAMSSQELTELYRTMLPDLLHNQQRFQEFVREQTFKIENLFE
jgi:hypothetical protein